MRYVVLFLLGSFGLLLLFVARYRYQAVNLQLSGMNPVEGIVDSIGPGGELHLKYSVGTMAEEIVRSLPVNFPRIRAGDKVTLLYDSARPDTAKVRHWSVLYQDSAVAGGFGLVAVFFAIGAFVMMGSVPSIRDALDATKNPQPYTGHKPEGSRPGNHVVAEAP